MAQIILKKSSVAARVPTITDLAFGELALNYADGLLYYKKSDNSIASIGGSSGLTTTTNRAMLISDGAGGVAESTNIFNIATNSSIDYLQLGDSTTGVSINGKGSPGYVGAPFLYTSNDDGSGYTHGTAAIMFDPNSTEITFGDAFSAYTGYSAAQQTISFNTSSHGVVGIFRDGNLHIGNNANYQISNRPGNIFLEQDKRISFIGGISSIDTNTAIWNNVDSYINPSMGATSFRGTNGIFEWWTAPPIYPPSARRPLNLTRVMTLDTDGSLSLGLDPATMYPLSKLDVNGGLTLRAPVGYTGYTTLLTAQTNATVTYTLPVLDGTAGQKLTTDGSGTLSWTTVSTSSGTAGTNAGIAISSNVFSTIYNSTISDSLTVPVAVGGITAGTTAATLKAKNIVSILDDLLFPTVPPTYTIPTIATFTATQIGVKEIGSTISQNLAQTQNKNDAGAYSQLVFKRNGTIIATTTSPTIATIADIASQFGYADPNNPNKSYTQSYIDSYQVVLGTTTWTAEGTYAAGLAKQNNKGVTDTTTAAVRLTSAPQAASTLASTGLIVTGIYPYYWGVSDTQPTTTTIASAIAAGTANKVLADAASPIAIIFNTSASGQYIWFATAATYTSKTTWYNTTLNNGSIGTSQFLLAPVTQAVSSQQGYWSNVSFKIYISNYATTTNGTLTFS